MPFQEIPAAGTGFTIAAFAPRVGLAYQFGDSGTKVVRAGYGKYDLQFPVNAYIGFSTQPFVRTYQNSGPFISLDNVWVHSTLRIPSQQVSITAVISRQRTCRL